MAKFFINRPIFAWVIAIVIMLAGTLSILNLPVSMYPQIAPPQVSISATYPGASAKTIEDTVVQVIEQKMTGLDGYPLRPVPILIWLRFRCRTVCLRPSHRFRKWCSA